CGSGTARPSTKTLTARGNIPSKRGDYPWAGIGVCPDLCLPRPITAPWTRGTHGTPWDIAGHLALENYSRALRSSRTRGLTRVAMSSSECNVGGRVALQHRSMRQIAETRGLITASSSRDKRREADLEVRWSALSLQKLLQERLRDY